MLKHNDGLSGGVGTSIRFVDILRLRLIAGRCTSASASLATGSADSIGDGREVGDVAFQNHDASLTSGLYR